MQILTKVLAEVPKVDFRIKEYTHPTSIDKNSMRWYLDTDYLFKLIIYP